MQFQKTFKLFMRVSGLHLVVWYLPWMMVNLGPTSVENNHHYWKMINNQIDLNIWWIIVLQALLGAENLATTCNTKRHLYQHHFHTSKPWPWTSYLCTDLFSYEAPFQIQHHFIMVLPMCHRDLIQFLPVSILYFHSFWDKPKESLLEGQLLLCHCDQGGALCCWLNAKMKLTVRLKMMRLSNEETTVRIFPVTMNQSPQNNEDNDTFYSNINYH